LDKVTGCVDAGSNVDAIFLDFAKAFDKVPHERLLLKLKSHGIEGKIAKWIREWLRDREQRVCIGGERSGWRKVTSGVPQGSVLGPVLFLIYINDLDNGVRNWILKFADDTKIFGAVDSDGNRKGLQEDLDNLVRWSEEWQMLFNTSKCKVMHIGKKNQQGKYSMNGKELEVVQHERDLGIDISNDLKVSTQCMQAYSRANRMLGLIKRTICNKSREIMLQLYKTLVRPHVEFCTAAWMPHYKKDKELIEKMQHRFTRMIVGMKGMEYDRRLDELGLWSLEERRNRSDLIEVYKMATGLSKLRLETFFQLNSTGITRGHSLKMRKQRNATDIRQHFFSSRVVNRWNELDGDIVTAASLNSFKSGLLRMRQRKMDLFRD
jgi:hypothetical protein